MKESIWNEDNIGNLTGKIVVITGSTSGIGKQAAQVMAEKNAKVIMAIRNLTKGAEVISEIKKKKPDADILMKELDLSSLDSVKTFSEELKTELDHIDVLINNAGIMMCPESKTKDGFELQLGTNHLGHFALTGRLLPLLKENSRVVVLSSQGHRAGKLNLDDLNYEKRKYNPNQVYFDSKLANLYFAYELAEKLKSKKVEVTAAHPGWTATDLQKHSGLLSFLNGFFAQGPDMGALPTLRAAFDQDASSGDYYGPAKFLEMRGNPIKVKSNKLSYNSLIAKELWSRSEQMTGVSF